MSQVEGPRITQNEIRFGRQSQYVCDTTSPVLITYQAGIAPFHIGFILRFLLCLQ